MQHRHPLPFGAELDGDGTRFGLWAPSAQHVALSFENDKRPSVPLIKEAGGWYTAKVQGIGAGTHYRYRIDGEIDVPDPASRYNPDGVHGVSEVIDPAGFDWQDGTWRGRPWHEAVIYELHVGTFTPEGTFDAIIPRLHELAALGINTLEIMPVNAFAGRRGWGYDGVLPFAPHPAYGRPDDLKRLVQAAHAHGIAVLLDVVYNHFGPEGNYLSRYAKDFFTERHHTPWGNAINFEGDSGRNVRQFFIQNALYWLNEYRFDGLRIDAVHAIVDDSQQHFIEELIDAVRCGPGSERLVHLVLENHRNESRYLSCDRGRCVAQWNDDFHHPLHVLITDETDGYYQDFAAQPREQLGRVLAEGFCFQGERARDGTSRGEPSAQLSPAAFVNFLQTHDQVGNRAFGERLATLAPAEAARAAMAILLLAPQVPMLFMGEEYAAPQPFLYFCDYTGELAAAITRGRRKEFEHFRMFADAQVRERIPDPNAEGTFIASRLRWGQRNEGIHREWQDYVHDLLQVRKTSVAPLIPQITGKSWSVSGTVVQATWCVAQGSLQLVANLGKSFVTASADSNATLLFNTHEYGSALHPWEVRLLKVSGRTE